MMLEFEFIGAPIKDSLVISMIRLAMRAICDEDEDEYEYLDDYNEWVYECGGLNLTVVIEPSGFDIYVKEDIERYEIITIATVLEAMFEEFAQVEALSDDGRVLEDLTACTVMRVYGMSEREYMDLWNARIGPLIDLI